MKTYKTTIEKPRLVIKYDEFAENPRKNDTNLGYFLTTESGYKSPDGNDSNYYYTIIETQYQADNIEEHMEFIKKAHKDIVAIYPITRYEHGNVIYKLGSFSGFDYSTCGFYIITKKTQKDTGVKKENFEKSIQAELDIYNSWVNGEVYEWTIFDEEGEAIATHDGYYSLEEIKEGLVAEYGDEWKDEDMEDYFIS